MLGYSMGGWGEDKLNGCLPLGALVVAGHLGVAGLGVAGWAGALALPGTGHLTARLR